MMTLYVTLKVLRNYNIDILSLFMKVSPSAASSTGTSAFLQKKEVISVHDLLFGLMLPSGNDASLVLAEGIGTILYFEEIEERSKIESLKTIPLKIKKKNKISITSD